MAIDRATSNLRSLRDETLTPSHVDTLTKKKKKSGPPLSGVEPC